MSVLKEEHDESLHPGYEKTIQKLKTRYYWPRMTVDTKRYVQACDVCKQCKPSSVSSNPPMGKQRLTDRPFQILALDFIQNLPRSRNGYIHLLVLMDIFSKWTMLVPIRKIEAKAVCRVVEDQWLRRYGTPEVIISDNATTFTGKEFQALLQKRGIRHWPNSRHHSQANPVERTNRTINSCLRTYMQPDQRAWDTRIPEVEEMINTTVHSSTGFSPYRILYGHEKVIKGEEHRMERDEGELPMEVREKHREEIGGNIREIVKRNLDKSDEKHRKVYNLRFKKFAPTFEVGQKVYKRNFRQSSAADHYNAKYGPLFIPCTIVAKRGSSSYELSDEQGKSLGVFSASDLRAGNATPRPRSGRNLKES
ncbi:hypothetical protein RP20_CCG007142 [Aedes albopictus]|nr:hypothetical protein RP20_CCG007142 [Aedes albopictus]